MGRAYKSSVRKPEGKNHLQDLNIDGRIILKWIFKNTVRMWTGFIWLRTESSGNELTGSIKGEKISDQLHDYLLLENDTTPWS
jgi:hypothetical protein